MYNHMQGSGVGDGGNLNAQPVISPVHQQAVYLRPSGPRTYKLSSQAFTGLGISQIFIAIFTISCQVAAIAVTNQPVFSGAGIYCPVIYIVAGAFGIASSQRKTTCPTVACMVLCILSAVFTATQFSLGVMYALMVHPSICYDCGSEFIVLFVTSIFMAILAVVECIIAIVCASLGCKAVCCGYANETMMAYTQTPDGETMIPLMVLPTASTSAGDVHMAPMAPEYEPRHPDMQTQASEAPPVPEKFAVA